MNALFCLIILMPIIPTALPQYLNELFDTFMRLAIWKARNRPELSWEQIIHLQIGITTLFQRLYGMFPCNFTVYIRDHIKENQLVYDNVIGPMLESVRIHPLLLTSNRESEKSVSRWKEMEPHDVVVECSKFTFENVMKLPEANEYDHQNDIKWNQQLMVDNMDAFCINKDVQQHTKLNYLKTNQKLEHIWSPSNAVLATPPPINPLMHTPSTSTQINPNYTIQLISGGHYTSGASPPEAAVEATPETTPLKEFIRAHRTYPVNSSAVRTIWGNTSQPSSPRKKDDNNSIQFQYPDTNTNSQIILSKIKTVASDRQIARTKSERQCTVSTSIEQNANNVFDIEILDPINTTPITASRTETDPIGKCGHDNNDHDDDDDDAINTESCQEDDEVLEINKHTVTNKFNIRNGTESEYASSKYREIEEIDDFSLLLNDKLSNSWPGRRLLKQNVETQTIRDDTDNVYEMITKEVLSNELNTDDTNHINYKNKIYAVTDPHELLDQYIEAAIKKQSHDDNQTLHQRSTEMQLLYLQLQYERYRREVHAERNRRLLGKSRDNVTLKMDNEKLRHQSERLIKELQTMRFHLNDTKSIQNSKEQDYSRQCEKLRNDVQFELNQNKDLQLVIDELKRNLTEQTEQKIRCNAQLDVARAELFDLKNLLQKSQEQAENGTQYKDELKRMQSKDVLLGEVQIKLCEKMAEFENLRAKEREMDSLKHSYAEEVRGNFIFYSLILR